MKNNPLFSIISDASDHLFITDKSGKVVFFPWGAGKQGYYFKNKNLAKKAKNFYKTSFYICFVLLIMASSFFSKNFWGIIGSMIVCLGGWYFSYFLYASRLVKSLPTSEASYKDLVLAKLETHDSEDKEEQIKTEFPSHWSKPMPRNTNDRFLGIKRIWYMLSPGQLFILYIFTGIGIIVIWSNLQQQKFGGHPIDYLIAFLVALLWGLASFVVASNIESDKTDWLGFINWKLPMILMTTICWIGAIFSLYKFFIMVFA